MKIPEPRRLPSGKWNVQVLVGGSRRSITRLTREECLREVMLIKAGAKEARILPAENKTIAQIVDEYVEGRESIMSPNTMNSWRQLRRHKFQRLMPMTYASVRNWQKIVGEELSGLAPSSAALYWSKLSTAIRSAGLPVPPVVLKKPQSQPKPYLTPDQIPAFLDLIRGHKYEIHMLLGLHGLRSGEIFGLRWEDIDLDRHLIRVAGTAYHDDAEGVWKRKNTTKTAGSRREVPFLIPRLEELIAEAGKDSFPLIGVRTTLNSAIQLLCEKNGLPKIGTHGLRRSFASLAYSKNVPERILMILGGWSDIQTVHKHYVQISQHDVSRYAAELRGFFEIKKETP